METVKDIKVHSRIESDLFHTNTTAYIVISNKNWSLLQNHVYLVEKYYKKHLRGKIPGKNDNARILEKYLNDNDLYSLSFYMSKQSGRCKHPPKQLRHGSSIEKRPSEIVYTALRNEGEEAEQLALVIKESLWQHEHK